MKICILQVQQKILERKASSKFEPKFLGQLSKLRSEELSGAKALLKRGNIAGNRQISEEKSFFTEQMIFLVIYITPKNINSAKVIHVQKIVWKLIKTISCVGEEKYRHVIPSFALTELSSVNNKRKTSWSSRFASYKNQYKRFYKPTSPILEKNFPPIFISARKIIHSIQCVFLLLLATCPIELPEDDSWFEEFLSPNYSKFAVKCDSPSKILRKNVFIFWKGIFNTIVGPKTCQW